MIIKNNIVFYVSMILIIIFGSFGVTFALKLSKFDPIMVSINTGRVDANITYNSDSNGNIVNFNGLSPIDDSLIINSFYTNDKMLRIEFNVSGVSSNPQNSIYDISFRDLVISPELKTTDLKWRLYKNGSSISEGNLSPYFDIMENNRLVLTNIQQDLTTNTDFYVFMLWISEACTGDITTCNSSQNQNVYLNKSISGNIKLELLTKSKKNIVRLSK